MDIEKILEFAKDGERSKNGLDVLLGFPRYEKPARQWFNSLFNDYSLKINELVTNVNMLINKPVVQTYAVGDIYITTKAHASAASVASQHGYGTWQKYGQGKTLVGVSTTSKDPSWTKEIGNTFGEYDHTLTLDEAPPHRHKLKHGYDNGSVNGGAGTVASDTGNWSGDFIPDANVSSEGGGLAHNNVQPSNVVAFWLRTA